MALQTCQPNLSSFVNAGAKNTRVGLPMGVGFQLFWFILSCLSSAYGFAYVAIEGKFHFPYYI